MLAVGYSAIAQATTTYGGLYQLYGSLGFASYTYSCDYIPEAEIKFDVYSVTSNGYAEVYAMREGVLFSTKVATVKEVIVSGMVGDTKRKILTGSKSGTYYYCIDAYDDDLNAKITKIVLTLSDSEE